MNVDDLLHEYRESLLPGPVLDFNVLLRKAAQRRRRQLTVAWVAMATAACFAAYAVFPHPESHRPQPLPPVPVAAVHLVELPIVAASIPPKAKPPRRRPLAITPNPVIWSNFVALAETDMLPNPGTIQLLSISVSRDRLSSLGVIPVSTGDDFEITAQVLLGDDGMARAIRVANNR